MKLGSWSAEIKVSVNIVSLKEMYVTVKGAWLKWFESDFIFEQMKQLLMEKWV